jgi:hypothetical protein
VVKADASEQVWKCEFCNGSNNLFMYHEEERPKTDAVNYLIEAAAQVEN